MISRRLNDLAFAALCSGLGLFAVFLAARAAKLEAMAALVVGAGVAVPLWRVFRTAERHGSRGFAARLLGLVGSRGLDALYLVGGLLLIGAGILREARVRDARDFCLRVYLGAADSTAREASRGVEPVPELWRWSQSAGANTCGALLDDMPTE